MSMTSYTRLIAYLTAASASAALGCSDKADDCKVLLQCNEEAGAAGMIEQGGSGGSTNTQSGGSGNRSSGGSAGKLGSGGSTTQPPATSGGSSAEAGSGGAAGDESAGGADEQGGEAGEGGAGGDGGAGGAGVIECDASASPGATPCAVDEAYAVFVAPSGMDGASGTRHAPVQTLAKAIELAAMDGKFVIACNGVYEAPLVLEAGIRLYGGFDCPGTSNAWTYVPGSVARVVPSERGAALSINGSNETVQIEDFEFRALDASDAGESSIAGTITNSKDVRLRRVHLIAGSGKSAIDAKNPGFTFPSVAELQGNSATDIGGAPKICQCPDGSSSTGGPAGSPPQQNGGRGTPAPAEGLGGEGGDATLACNSGGGGSAGANGKSASDAPGANILGTLMTMGWMPAAGTAGRAGMPGQGGGGGAGKPGGGGGGGGCGGCGGRGGAGGKGGGSSIALVLYESKVVIDAGELTSAAAGNGGRGAPGQAGQATFGGGGDGAGQGDAGCDGGNGGLGGDGGSGGGGAGGMSVGVLYKGEAPTISGVTVVSTGTSGMGGIGGTPGSNDGMKGVSQPTYAIN